MRKPVTTIDRRYSDPVAAATEWEETRRVLETAEVFWLSTVRADGRSLPPRSSHSARATPSATRVTSFERALELTARDCS